ncbi:hypothetical protein GCM10011507_12510 [Edaphobacter acidisoli]|uniref:Secreted protein n=1 Tax=Edaphobacter acidisoli TaxID=2040573 RepID=A0A916RQH2_9BACT|nr:hypothetical protein [Edaphobacter acidisoli]GGA62455.1 hypothetical protein GCM10011507_12510 [Edaphobacter acidisoli]
MEIKFLFHCAKVSAASVLIVGLSFAQSSQTTTARTVRKSGSIVVADRQSAREAGSGMATGRRQYSPTMQTIDSDSSAQRKNRADFPRSLNSRNSAHATESLNQPANAAKGENPLYEDHGKSGTNPMYESGKDAIAKPDTSSSGYKDGEAFEMRKSGSSQQSDQGTTGFDALARKHPAGVKYENRTAAGQQSSTSSSGETVKQDFGQVQATKR